MKKLFIPFIIPKLRQRKAKMPTPGSDPGTLLVPSTTHPPQIYHWCFCQEACSDQQVKPEDLARVLQPVPGSVTWLDVQGLGDPDLINQIGKILDLDPLTIEDIVHTHQRPKAEEFNDYLFIVMRAIYPLGYGLVENEQLSLVLKDGILVTFQETPGDGFDPVRRRLKDRKTQVRRCGADYLAYALIDMSIDNYFPVLDIYAESMDRLEERTQENPDPALSKAIHVMRRELRQLRRAVWPVRDMISLLGRHENPLFSENVRPSLRDCHDHVVQVAEFIEGTHERASDLAGLYLAVMSERTNSAMKVLTMIATIFIPLTFLCGVYGMNYDPEASPFNMPELRWRYGYPVFWLLTLVITLGMVWYFRSKGWIGRKTPSQNK